MAEIAPRLRPALAYAAIGDETRARLEPLAEGHVLHALSSAGAEDAEARLARVADGTAYAVRRYAPGQWFVVGSSRLDPAVVREKDTALGPDLRLSDQSCGRVRLAVSGPGSRGLLAKGSAVDFSARAFPLGSSAATLFNHISVHVTRTGDARFEMVVLRSSRKVSGRSWRFFRAARHSRWQRTLPERLQMSRVARRSQAENSEA